MRFRWTTAKSFGPAKSMALLRRPLVLAPYRFRTDKAPVFRFDAFSLREPASTSLENATLWFLVARGQPSNRRHQRGTERVLEQRCRNKRQDANRPGLVDAELHAERQPREAGAENEDVSDSHRDEQPRHRPVPAALAQPARGERR